MKTNFVRICFFCAFLLKKSAKLSIVFRLLVPYCLNMITKKLESVTQINTDVSIVGGGLAGVCAAIAAARHGSSVALIQSRPVLGGNSSSEIRVWTRGATGGGNLFAEEMGILGELKLANQYRNPEGNPILWDAILLDYVLMEPNITLYLNTFVSRLKLQMGTYNRYMLLK